jgi:hypothetical protein
MTLDNAIKEAIANAVEEHGQPQRLAEKLISWFSELAKSNESIDDKEAVFKRLEILFSAVELPEIEED